MRGVVREVPPPGCCAVSPQNVLFSQIVPVGTNLRCGISGTGIKGTGSKGDVSTMNQGEWGTPF